MGQRVVETGADAPRTLDADRVDELRRPAEVGGVMIDLDGAGLRQEGVVGEIGAQHEKQVGLVAGS
jgi:hypothetical protein